MSLSQGIATDPLPADRSDGVRVILRMGRRPGIGRPTYFRKRGQPAATTWCFTSQRVAATRLDTPIFV